MEAIHKLQQIFKNSPWLKDSKNVIHLPIVGIKDGLQWNELWYLINKLDPQCA